MTTGCGQCIPAHGHRGRTPNLARRLSAKWRRTSRTDGRKTTYDTWATCCYNRTSKGMAVAESSLERSSARRWCSVSRKELAWKGRGCHPVAAQARGRHKELMLTLGRWWVTRPGGAHRRWGVAVAWSNGDGRGDGQWQHNLGQKKRHDTVVSWVKWIDYRWSDVAASRWWADGGDLPQLGEKVVKGEKLLLASCVYCQRRERARGWAPRVSIRCRCWAGPASHQCAPIFPVPGSPMGGPRSVFEGWHESKPALGLHCS
jgi:hypothetical protein